MTISEQKNKMIELIMTIAGLMGSIATIPQIIKVFITHPTHAVGLSLITWTAYCFICSLWVAYGVYFKKKAVLITNAAYVFMYVLVIVGILYNAQINF